MIMDGMYHQVRTLIRRYPYRVVRAFRRNHDIFAYLACNCNDGFHLILIPQNLHDSFKRLCILLRENIVVQVHLKYVGDNVDGEPILHAYDSYGFSAYL
jgi:hypothetical protein